MKIRNILLISMLTITALFVGIVDNDKSLPPTNVVYADVSIPKINVNENYTSLEDGIYKQDDNIICGHRGGVFLRLDELNVGDELFIEGKQYEIINKKVVSPDYKIVENGNKFAYTCTLDNTGRILLEMNQYED